MARLIVILFLIAGVALAFAAIMIALRAVISPTPIAKGDTMPDTFRNIAYLLLLILLFGLTMGWIGG